MDVADDDREQDVEKMLRRWGLLDESDPSERKIVEIVEAMPSAGRHVPPLVTKHLETKPRTDEEMLRNTPSPIGRGPVESLIGMASGSRNIQTEALRSSGAASPELFDVELMARVDNKSGRQLWTYVENVPPPGSTCLWCYLLGEDVRLLLSECPEATLILESAITTPLAAPVSLRGVTAAGRKDWHFLGDPVAIARNRRLKTRPYACT
jgi:hypothetical protein